MSGFGGGWSGPSSTKASPAPASPAPPSQKKPTASAPAPPAKVGATNADSNTTTDQQPQKYHALVVDSGAIIKHSAFSTLHNAAETYYTVPAVLDEIRDAKAREHLDNLPFELQTRVPTAEAMKAMSDFSRLTGDYRSLSSVDMQVLALLYDLGESFCLPGMTLTHVLLLDYCVCVIFCWSIFFFRSKISVLTTPYA